MANPEQRMVVNGGNFCVIIPATETNDEITALGTAINLEALQDTKIVIANPESKSEYAQMNLDNGVTVEIPKVTKILDGKTGSEKSGSGTDGYDSAEITMFEVDADSVSSLQGLFGKHVFICVPLGQGTCDENEGYAFLYCKLTSNIERSTKGNEPVTIAASFSGDAGKAGTGFDYADLNTGFGIAAAPMGGTAITKIIDTANAFVAGDLTTLLTGRIVLKDAV